MYNYSLIKQHTYIYIFIYIYIYNIGKYYGAIFVHYKPKDPKYWGIKFEDIIAHVPPHWNEGIKYEKGSRFSGAALTIDRLVLHY